MRRSAVASALAQLLDERRRRRHTMIRPASMRGVCRRGADAGAAVDAAARACEPRGGFGRLSLGALGLPDNAASPASRACRCDRGRRPAAGADHAVTGWLQLERAASRSWRRPRTRRQHPGIGVRVPRNFVERRFVRSDVQDGQFGRGFIVDVRRGRAGIHRRHRGYPQVFDSAGILALDPRTVVEDFSRTLGKCECASHFCQITPPNRAAHRHLRNALTLSYGCVHDQGTAPPRLRRAYFECRHGQLHVHNAIPVGGGFDELTTLICLHGSGRHRPEFLELSKRLGTSRSIYSPDLPGCGESDAPPTRLSIGGLRRCHRRFPRFHALPPGGLVRRGRRRRGGGRTRREPAEGGAQTVPAGCGRQGNDGPGARRAGIAGRRRDGPPTAGNWSNNPCCARRSIDRAGGTGACRQARGFFAGH